MFSSEKEILKKPFKMIWTLKIIEKCFTWNEKIQLGSEWPSSSVRLKQEERFWNWKENRWSQLYHGNFAYYSNKNDVNACVRVYIQTQTPSRRPQENTSTISYNLSTTLRLEKWVWLPNCNYYMSVYVHSLESRCAGIHSNFTDNCSATYRPIFLIACSVIGLSLDKTIRQKKERRKRHARNYVSKADVSKIRRLPSSPNLATNLEWERQRRCLIL